MNCTQTDRRTYCGPDSGCNYATEYLGEKSSCLKCPFAECVFIAREHLSKARRLVLTVKNNGGK